MSWEFVTEETKFQTKKKTVERGAWLSGVQKRGRRRANKICPPAINKAMMVAAEGLVCISRTFDADRLDVLLGIAIVVDAISRNVHVQHR